MEGTTTPQNAEIAPLILSLFDIITSYTSSAMREAGFFVFGWTCLWSFSTTSLKTLSVDLWRLLTCAARTLSRNCPRETRRLSHGHVDGVAVA